MTAPKPAERVELLPCPFCGSDHPQWVGSSDGDYVECGSCLAMMRPHDPEVPDEVARWNTRLTPPTGMVMVPEEATDAVIDAMADVQVYRGEDDGVEFYGPLWHSEAREVYTAMIASALGRVGS